MQKVKVTWDKTGIPCNGLYATGTLFSWANRLEGGIRQQTRWHTCRETFVTELSKWHDPNYPHKWIERIGPPSLKRTRFLCGQRFNRVSETHFKTIVGEINTQMKNVQKFLNMIEKHLGWPLTRIYQVEDEKELEKFRIVCHLIDGPAKWISATQLASLYLLFIRLAPITEITNIEKFDDLKHMEKIVSSAKAHHAAKHKVDLDFLWRVSKHLKVILENVDDLFLFRPVKLNFIEYKGVNGIYNYLGIPITSELGKRRIEILGV